VTAVARLAPAHRGESCTEAVRLFADFLGECGHPLTVEAITRHHVRAFAADQLERWKPSWR
jgi:hypothetical protein